jgi:hypothetical protein
MLLNPSETSYTALIRWQGPDPAVEIETRHPGFTEPEEAALFANSFSPDAPLSLRVGADASLSLLLSDGRYVKFAGDVTLWTLGLSDSRPASPDDTGPELLLAHDEDFQAHPLDHIRDTPSAHGDYEQAQYAVLTDDGYPLDVIVDWDESDHLRMTVSIQVNKNAPKVAPTLCIGCA